MLIAPNTRCSRVKLALRRKSTPAPPILTLTYTHTNAYTHVDPHTCTQRLCQEKAHITFTHLHSHRTINKRTHQDTTARHVRRHGTKRKKKRRKTKDSNIKHNKEQFVPWNSAPSRGLRSAGGEEYKRRDKWLLRLR